MSRDQADGTNPDDAVFDGASPELAALLRSVDWAATPLGPVQSWSPVLRLMVPTILRAGLPAVINWGPEFVAIYNDAYAPVLGRKHPAGGQTTRQTWPEAWQWVRPRLERVYRDGATVAFDDEQLILHRNGYPEECYFTFSQSPIVDVDGGIGGVLTVATETTPRVLSERRMRIVRELGALTAADTGGVVGTCRAAARVLATARESLPFAVVFLIDTPNTTAGGARGDTEAAPDGAGALQMVAGYGVASANGGSGEAGDAADLTSGRAPGWAAAAASRATTTGEVQVLHGVPQLAGTGLLPGPLGPLLPDTAVVVPLTVSGRPQPVGAVVLGINPYRPLDKDYQSFIQLIVRQLRVNLTDADVHEREQRRLRLLADLDNAKTVFLQNTSHELRTPLTLLLAPLQDLLARTADDTDRADLRAAVRAAERLRGIIDSQFDFTGAAPGALVPDLRPVDIAAITVEAADLFNSAAEHAGLAFTVDVPTDPVTAVADRSMWATVVTNLVSNAVKYTATGAVTVRVRPAAAEAVLTVTDTGTGISRHHQASVFERFYRAAPDPAAPGSGIGLALVADLVRAQHGRVDLHSAPGKGTTVTVTIPLGAATAPGDTDTHPATARTGAVPASVDAWPRGGTPPTVLIVEDDPDLRGYLTRLLIGDGWAVTAVPDAETADSTVMSSPIPPDVVLTDVMLPGRSGLHLVGQLRKHPATSRMPILVLTARGGPDAAADGLAAGADDYISKPFSSRELLARIRTNHELHQLRQTAVDAAEAKAQQIRGALDSNRVIGTATGIVMATYQLTAQQAFKLLTVASQNTNSKLRDIADTVTATGALPYRRTTIDDLLIRAATPPSPKPT